MANTRSSVSTESLYTLPNPFSPVKEANRIYQSILARPKEDLEKNRSHIILELAKNREADTGFVYTTMKLLYQIKCILLSRIGI